MGGCGEPRGIVGVGFDPWTPCHMSTNPNPFVDSPSHQKTEYNRFVLRLEIQTTISVITVVFLLGNPRFKPLFRQ